MAKELAPFTIELEEKNSQVKIALGKISTYKDLPGLTEQDFSKIKNHNSVLFDLSKNEEADVSVLQLLMFILKMKIWDKVSIKPTANKKLIDLFSKSGFRVFTEKK